MSWSKTYKKSIDCDNPKGFSQKAHCDGRKARQRGEKTTSDPVNENMSMDIDFEYVLFCETARKFQTKSLNEISIPSFLSKQFDFIKKLASETSFKVADVVKMFMNKTVFSFFSKIKWDLSYLFDLMKKGFGAYKDVINAVSEYVSKSKVGKWTEGELTKLDEWLKNHPKVKRIGGVLVAGLLIYIWFNMAFTGDVKYDFDLTDAVAALSGKFSLSQLFAGADGTKLLMLFATGVLGLTFPWPGPTSIKFLTTIIRSVANWAKVKLTKEGTMKKSEIREIIREEIQRARLEEKVQLFLEKNCPTDSSKWSYWKGQAKQKFDVYPSAYANGWAAKMYKDAGGGWKDCE
jgi:hypothetical protein